MAKPKQQQAQVPPMLEKLRAMAKSVRTGGKGSMRRKNKVVHHTSSDDDKKVTQFIQQNGCRELPNIDAIDIMKSDMTIMQFTKPKRLLHFFNIFLIFFILF